MEDKLNTITIEKKANKKYVCDNCGCNIEKGFLYKVERIWSKGHVDEDGDWCVGHMKTWRSHLSESECSIAIRLVEKYFNYLGKL